MSAVDTDKFPETALFQVRMSQAKGLAVKGVAAVLSTDVGIVTLVAPDVETLETYWDVIADIPLCHDGVQSVAIFSSTLTQEIPQ